MIHTVDEIIYCLQQYYTVEYRNNMLYIDYKMNIAIEENCIRFYALIGYQNNKFSYIGKETELGLITANQLRKYVKEYLDNLIFILTE